MESDRILKIVIKPSKIEARNKWSLAEKENLWNCYDCKGHLFYARVEHGVVKENTEYQILGHKNKTNYSLREIGMSLYCAECGSFQEFWNKNFYDTNQLIISWDDKELDGAEKEHIEQALEEYNMTRTINEQIKKYCPEIIALEKELKKSEEENKEK